MSENMPEKMSQKTSLLNGLHRYISYEEERIILMKFRNRKAERMSEFKANIFQYNVTVGIIRSKIIFCLNKIYLIHT